MRDRGLGGDERPLRLCLAASGGGHLRQLLDLQPVWSRHDSFFVTEDTALGESIGREHRSHFVAHYSFGQARWGHPLKMLGLMLRNLAQSVRIVTTERPDVVITSGAGAVFWVAILARLFGARLIMVESFARFRGPSMFGRMVRPFATDLIVQSPIIKERWPEARLFDPFKLLSTPRPQKKPLVLATVGATLPFDRLIEGVLGLVESGALTEQVIAQVGEGSNVSVSQSAQLRRVESLAFDEVKAILRDAELVITHGGTGSLITALREGCRVIAMPRLFRYKEHYDDHQLEIVTAFAERGVIEVALEQSDLGPAIERARSKEPRLATADHSAFLGWLGDRLAGVAKEKGRRVPA